MRNGPVQPDPRTKNEDARLGRQGDRRNGHQTMDNTLNPEAEKNLIAHRHQWEPRTQNEEENMRKGAAKPDPPNPK